MGRVELILFVLQVERSNQAATLHTKTVILSALFMSVSCHFQGNGVAPKKRETTFNQRSEFMPIAKYELLYFMLMFMAINSRFCSTFMKLFRV